jgi:hypothetical protein
MAHDQQPRRTYGKWLNSCRGKKVYESAQHARWDAEQLRRKHDEVYEAYACPFHHEHGTHWHVGHGDDVARQHKLHRRKAIQEGMAVAIAVLGLGRPAASAASGTDWIVEEIYAAAARWGASGDEMLGVARCESGLDPGAVNPRTGDAGLFQFSAATWAEFWAYLNEPAPDIFSVWAQCHVTAWAFSRGYQWRWCCHEDWSGGTCQ